MRVREMSVKPVPAGPVPLSGVELAPTPTNGLARDPKTAQFARPRVDVTAIMAVPDTELTPRVRAVFGKLLGTVQALRQDLVRARRRIDYLEQLADRDPLAPVLNRRAFERELTRMIAFTERYGVPGSVVYLDIDGMKRINDSHGHGAGDAVLKHVAEILLRDVRASDIVGRLGGDEFGVILTQADRRAAAVKAAALAKAIEGSPMSWQDDTLDLGVSYGAHTFAGGEAVDEALGAADRAMYAHKQGAEVGGSDSS